MNDLLQFDRWLFHKMNLDWSFPIGDFFFGWITDFHKTSAFIYGIIPLCLIFSIRFLKKRSFEMLTALAVALIATDYISGILIKPFVGRLRPLISEVGVVQRADIFGRFSFPSNHASNAFCAAVVLSFHFPGDCLVGAIFGTLIGLIVVLGVKRIFDRPSQGIQR